MPSLFLPSVLLNQDENLSFLLLACCVSDTAGVTNNMSVLSHLLHTASTPISPSQTLRCFCFKSVCLEYPMLSLSQEVRCGGIAVGALCQEVSRDCKKSRAAMRRSVGPCCSWEPRTKHGPRDPAQHRLDCGWLAWLPLAIYVFLLISVK